MISNQEIRAQVVHEVTYTKGVQYYSKGKVAHLSFDPKERIFSADVMGQQRYHVKVYFSELQKVQSATCQCQAYANYKGACKHIVAVLKSIQMNWDKHWKQNYDAVVPDLEAVTKGLHLNGRFVLGQTKSGEGVWQSDEDRKAEAEEMHVAKLRKRLEERATKRFYEGFERLDRKNQISTGEVVLLPSLVIGDGGVLGPSKSLELALKSNRTYILKDIGEFILQVVQHQPVSLSKAYTFDPNGSELDYNSQLLMAFLENLYWNERQLAESLGGAAASNYSRIPSIFNGRHLYLTDQSLKDFLDLMEDQPFELRIESYLEKDSFQVQTLYENPAIEIQVMEDEQGMLLTVDESKKSLRVLDLKGEIIFHKGHLYRTEPSYGESMVPLLAQASELPDIRVGIDPDKTDYFFSRILPKLEQQSNVRLSPSLEKQVVREPLEVEVYLDQWKSEIVADVVFKYGEYEIQPFNANQIVQGEKTQLIRDFNAEEECLLWFKSQGFLRVESSLRLEDVEAIGDFFQFGLDELLAMATVFRTERFLNLKIRVPNPFKIQCQMEQQSGLLEMEIKSEGLSKEELLSLIQAYRLKKRYHRLKSGDLVLLSSDGPIGDLDALSTHLNVKANVLISETLQLPAYRAVYLEALGKDREGLRIERNQAFKNLIRNLENPEEIEVNIPEGLKSILRDYQLTGVKWLKVLTKFGFGGILADDMGLGKTLQILALLLSEKEEKERMGEPAGRALIVVPTSLIYNWQAEIEKFAPELNPRIVVGQKHERNERLMDLTGVDIVLTTYGLLKRDIDYYRALNFEYCIIDEAQHIKNANTLSAKSVKCIKAKNTLALTGTPIENGLTELWSIFDFIMPGYLYQNAQFINRYSMPIMRDNDEEVKAHLRRHIQPFVMRRLKKDVLRELPEKIESVMYNQMSTEQAKLYAAWQMRAKKEFEEEVSQSNGQTNKIKILALLTRLRQLACHPALFVDSYKGGSGKLEQLMELVEDAVSGGHRLLIFSQFTSLLGHVQKEMENAQISYWYLDGSVSSQDRIDRVKAFNEGEGSVFLISLKAGGTGLNLTGADMVVHLDPWWNPAVEDQATDRAYRIGQTKAVQVFRMITKGTIEEKIDELKLKKRNLIEDMIQPGETWLNQMSNQELMKLFL